MCCASNGPQIVWGGHRGDFAGLVILRGLCNSNGYTVRPNLHIPTLFQKTRLQHAVFWVFLSYLGPKCALTPSDPWIRAGKLPRSNLARPRRRGLKKSVQRALQNAHGRFLRRTEGVGPMALTAVSRLVVVDGDSFLNALFASAGQDRRAMEHRPQDRGPRRRTIDWQLDDRGALEARLGNVFNDLQSCNSNLICSL